LLVYNFGNQIAAPRFQFPVSSVDCRNW